LFKLEEAES